MRQINPTPAVQVIGLCLVVLLLVTPRHLLQHPPLSWYEHFHNLIVSGPNELALCGEPEAQRQTASDPDTLEIRFVQIPYGVGKHTVPPLSGYVTDVRAFMEGVQGDVRCSTLVLPACVVAEGMPWTFQYPPLTFRVLRAKGGYRLEYTCASGATYAEEFTLPYGEVFATNLGEQPVGKQWSYPELPTCLSFLHRWLGRSEPLQMECFIFVSRVRAGKRP